MMLESQDSKTQPGILYNLFARGRVKDELNQRGTVAFLGAPDWPAMVDEGLAV